MSASLGLVLKGSGYLEKKQKTKLAFEASKIALDLQTAILEAHRNWEHRDGRMQRDSLAVPFKKQNAFSDSRLVLNAWGWPDGLYVEKIEKLFRLDSTKLTLPEKSWICKELFIRLLPLNFISVGVHPNCNGSLCAVANLKGCCFYYTAFPQTGIQYYFKSGNVELFQ